MENLKYSEILQLNRALSNEVKGKPYKVSILSNVTVNSFQQILEYSLRVNQVNPEVTIGNFDNIVQDSATVSDADLVIIFYEILNIVDSVSGFFEGLDEEAVSGLNRKICSEIDIVFSNLMTVPAVVCNTFSAAGVSSSFLQNSRLEEFVKDLNNYLFEKKPANVTLADTDKIIRRIGTAHAFDFRLYHSSKAPYTLQFFKNYAGAIEPVVLRNTGKLKKALIFDCDNTLWKGIIGEDGVEGIHMGASTAYGKAYHAVQQIAVFLSKRGVIIGICSKNNEQDVIEVMLNHPDMILKEEHIVIKKVNWTDKATNLRAIASELNIGTDSLVFVDDSSFEINLIKEQLPEVLTLQVPSSIHEYPELLLRTVYAYFNLSISSEDAKKTEMYKQQFLRENAKKEAGSIEDYLASLEISLIVLKDESSQVERVAQLTQKTNQFNLTTRRYTESRIQEFTEDEQHAVFALQVKDKFGDNGLTAVCIAAEEAEDVSVLKLDTFLMSCRIIGRNIEVAFLNYIVGWAKERGYSTLKAEYFPTKKNGQVQDFYAKYGFEVKKTSDEGSEYSLVLADFDASPIEYIHLEEMLRN